MAYLETVTEEITRALAAAGAEVYDEFRYPKAKLPVSECFVTVGIERFELSEPFSEKYFPAILTLRIRLHTRTDSFPARTSILFELTVLPVLRLMGLSILRASLGELRYDMSLALYVREGKIEVSALLRAEEEQNDLQT